MHNTLDCKDVVNNAFTSLAAIWKAQEFSTLLPLSGSNLCVLHLSRPRLISGDSVYLRQMCYSMLEMWLGENSFIQNWAMLFLGKNFLNTDTGDRYLMERKAKKILRLCEQNYHFHIKQQKTAVPLYTLPQRIVISVPEGNVLLPKCCHMSVIWTKCEVGLAW